MSTTPPSIPPDVPAAEPARWTEFWGSFWESLFGNLPTGLELSAEPIGNVVAQVVAFLAEVLIGITAELGKRYGEGIDEFESTAGPTILNAAARGVSDYFGVPVSPGQLDPNRPHSEKFRFAEQLGRLVLENMFGAFDAPRPLSPDAGRDNAERLLGFNIATALESWIGQITTEAPLLRFIPNWADLDDLLSANLGLGRANRRVIGPLLKTLIVDPFTWDLNRRFAPTRFSPQELFRLDNRRALSEGEFFEQMSWHGYSQDAAGKFRILNYRYPEKEDLARMLELGLITPERATAVFEALGFTPTAAPLMTQVLLEDRVRTINTSLEALARDMYRDRVIDQGEFRSILQAAKRAPQEIESLVGLVELERARPRPLPRSDVEEGFRRGLIPLSRLREYYSQFGLALEDQVLLEEMAVEDRLAAEAREEAAKLKAEGRDFREVPAGQIERAYIEGRIAAARLREYYEARRYAPDDVALLLEIASARKTDFDRARALELERAKTPEFTALPKATMEEAFMRDVVDAGRLREYYSAIGLSPADADVALRVARDKKAERAERLEPELARANRPDFLELPRAVMEEAFLRGIVTEGRLRSYYEGRGFRETEIPILLELILQKKAERAAAAARKAATPGTTG